MKTITIYSTNLMTKMEEETTLRLDKIVGCTLHNKKVIIHFEGHSEDLDFTETIYANRTYREIVKYLEGGE